MDVARALPASAEWSSCPAAPSPRPLAMAAAGDPGIDLDRHLRDLADAGELEPFLGQVRDAIALAGADRTFGEQLDPLLGRIREALAGLDTGRLPRVERDAVEHVLGELDVHLGGRVEDPEGPGAPVEVPGGGLEAHEEVGGHLIERHVGKSEEWLVDRVRRENISAASSFRDLGEAEYFVARTLDQHQDAIDAWLDGQGGNRLVIDARFDASTGISVERGDTRAEDVFSIRLVLERSERLDTGYRIVTGYPSAP